MDKKCLTIICLLYVSGVMSSLPRSEEKINNDEVPFKLSSTQNTNDTTVKHVATKYNEEWNSLQTKKEIFARIKKPKEGSETGTQSKQISEDGFFHQNIVKENMKDSNNSHTSEKEEQTSMKEANVGDDVVSAKEVFHADEESKAGTEHFNEDFQGDPNLIQEAFIPLSPSIRGEDLIKFLASEDIQPTPNSYHHFQIIDPVQDLEVVKHTTRDPEERKKEDATRQMEPQQTSDREARKTNFRRTPYESLPWSRIRRGELVGFKAESFVDNMKNVVEPIASNGLKLRLQTPSGRDNNYQVIRVYAEKPNSNKNVKEQFFATKPPLVLNDFSKVYEENINAHNFGDKFENKESLNPTLNNHFEPTPFPRSDEATMRNMIQNQIGENMYVNPTSPTVYGPREVNGIKRSDSIDDIDFIDVANCLENEIDLEDKINEIENQMDKLKKNNGLRSSKVDRVFENVVKIVKKCQNDSNRLSFYDCLKDQVLKSIESLMFNANKTVPIVPGLLYLENDLPLDQREAVIAENRGLDYNHKILIALNMWLNNLSFRVKFPANIVTKDGVNIGRGKKDKYGHLMLLTTLLLMGTMIPIKMGMIATMAGKALTISIISLTLAIIMGLKKLGNGHGSGHTTYEVINVPAGSGGHGEGRISTYLSRNLKVTPSSYTAGQSKSTTSRPYATLSYHSPYSTFATPFDSEHEGEISLDETPVTDENDLNEDEKYHSLSRYSVDPPWRGSSDWIAKRVGKS